MLHHNIFLLRSFPQDSGTSSWLFLLLVYRSQPYQGKAEDKLHYDNKNTPGLRNIFYRKQSCKDALFAPY